MKLYEIDKAIEDLIDQETGEITDLESVIALQMERDTKLENLACAVKNYIADAEMLRMEKNNLAEREAAARKKAEKARAYLEFILQGESFESPKVKVSFRKSEAAEVEDESAAFTFLRAQGFEDAVKVTFAVNKAEAKKLLKQGVAVPGMKLVEKMNMGVR